MNVDLIYWIEKNIKKEIANMVLVKALVVGRTKRKAIFKMICLCIKKDLFTTFLIVLLFCFSVLNQTVVANSVREIGETVSPRRSEFG